MSRMFDIKVTPKVAIGAAVLVGGAIAYVGYTSIKRKLAARPPSSWQKVGEVTDLLCYPIKSCGFIRVEEFNCEILGPESNQLRDRIFMIVKNGEFITARAYPKLVSISPVIKGETMTLSAPGMMDIDVDINRLYNLKPDKNIVWGEAVDSVDAGEEVAKWISRFILAEDTGLRLVFYPGRQPQRKVRPKNVKYGTDRNDTGALHDATAYMLVNESSIADLNTRLKKPITPLQMRPNIVIKGPDAFEEDNWDWIKIGNDVILQGVQPCTRCIFTNIDPETAERNPDEEPLKTLKSYRQLPKSGESPVMGLHLGMRIQGTIKLGDSIYVGSKN